MVGRVAAAARIGLVAALVTFTPRLAAGEDARGPWFGWQVMLVDVGATALIAGGGALTSTSSGFAVLPILGGVTYLGGGPLVHALHDDPGGSARSIALRVGVPIATGGIFAGLAALTASSETSDICYPHSERTCAAIYGAAVGIGVGMIGAMVVDWITSSEPARTAAARDDGERPAGVERPRWAVLPVPLRGGPGLAIAGTF